MQKVIENPNSIDLFQSRISEILKSRHVQIKELKKQNEIKR
jgi:hypothetical protein